MTSAIACLCTTWGITRLIGVADGLEELVTLGRIEKVSKETQNANLDNNTDYQEHYQESSLEVGSLAIGSDASQDNIKPLINSKQQKGKKGK